MMSKVELNRLGMKSYSWIFLCAALAMFAACGEKEQTPIPTGEIVITASTEADAGTRTTLDADYTTVLWMPKESISVFGNGEMAIFTADNAEKTKTANFRGTLPKGSDGQILYGLYPYNAEATISKDVITGGDFLKEGETMVMASIDESTGTILTAEAPVKVVLQVTYTEPGFAGNTATNATKPATLETGVEIRVPLFINEGDMIEVDTRDGSYVTRK